MQSASFIGQNTHTHTHTHIHAHTPTYPRALAHTHTNTHKYIYLIIKLQYAFTIVALHKCQKTVAFTSSWNSPQNVGLKWWQPTDTRWPLVLSLNSSKASARDLNIKKIGTKKWDNFHLGDKKTKCMRSRRRWFDEADAEKDIRSISFQGECKLEMKTGNNRSCCRQHYMLEVAVKMLTEREKRGKSRFFKFWSILLDSILMHSSPFY